VQDLSYLNEHIIKQLYTDSKGNDDAVKKKALIAAIPKLKNNDYTAI